MNFLEKDLENILINNGTIKSEKFNDTVEIIDSQFNIGGEFIDLIGIVKIRIS